MDLALDSDVLAARTGDRGAFGRLVARYSGVVTSISLSTVRNVATSEEVAQDVFLDAWRDLKSLRNPSSFLPWLRQLTRHRALDAARRARRPDERAAQLEDDLSAAIDPGPGAEAALIEDERSHAVLRALDALPADAREVLTLFYREGRSVAQVALLLGLREDTVKKRLSRARAELREEVVERFGEVVEASAPGKAFEQQVIAALPMMSPLTAWVAVKGVLHLLAKWAVVVAGSGAVLAGIFAAAVPIYGGIRKELKLAVDDRERRELRFLGVVATVNAGMFCVAIPALKHLIPGDARFYGSLWAVMFALLHVAIYGSWMPRIQARRRASASFSSDGEGALSTGCCSKRRQSFAMVASALIVLAAVAGWIR